MPASGVTGLAIVLGLVHGFLNGCALREGAGTPGLLGIAALLFVVVTLLSALAVSIGKSRARIAVRVVGSWIASIGILMFGWMMK
jgi:hydrogenase/urease accessory protein HupE